MAISGLTAFNITSTQGALIYFLYYLFAWNMANSWEAMQGWLKNSAVERIVYIILGLSMVASLLLANFQLQLF